MKVYPTIRRLRGLGIALASAGLILQPLAAADANDETQAGIAADAAVTGSAVAKSLSGSLIGVTLAPGGFSLAAVNVVIRSLSDSAGHQLISDADGTFSIKNLLPGTYQITAAKDGFATAAATVEVAASRTANATVQLTQGISGSLRGVTLAPDGFSLGEVNIAIHSVAGSVDRNLVSDADGMFVVKDLPPGSYQIIASKENYTSPQPVTVEVAQNRTSNANMQLAQQRPVLTAQAAPPVQTAQAPPQAQQALPPNAVQPTAPAAPGTPAAASTAATVPAVDLQTPFAYADFTWLNGSPRNKDVVVDTPFFTPEVRFDTHYMEDYNQPHDHTIVGATESFRSGEIQIEQASVGGDFHWQGVRGRILFMQGLFSTTTPRNDASSATGSAPGSTGGVGQWDLQNAYKYVSEAYGGYHFNVQHGLNVDAGIFVSYIGLFSYYNFDNWTYQPSYVSSNTPWFFNGLRAQWFPTNKLKIEPWFINGWQSYAKYNGHPGLGGQLLWLPKEWFKLVANQYGFGQDNLGLPHTERIHTDDSIEVRYYNKPDSLGISKMAFSLTGDAGCQYGGGIQCTGARSNNKSSFIGWMLYDRYWFHKDTYAVTFGGGEMSNWGRYLTLLPPIDGAWAASGTPYFTENPGQRAHMWDSTINFQWMPKQYITWWAEVGYRHSDIPYFAGRGGVTPPGGNNGLPQYYTCMSGASAGTAELGAAIAACGGPGTVWFPDLRRSEAKTSFGVMVKF
jgi:Putative beta-barrel porin-2, OmpL-like. bbp2/Carboxypeptidase regulatory-like domain